ncbi:MAG: hypothetical protein R6V35_00460 [Candidatus Nanohaloarchaea archaeon]
MSSRKWEGSFEKDPENYDSNVNDYQPDQSNPHVSEDKDSFIHDALSSATSNFESEEVPKSEVYSNAADVSEILSERFERGDGYLMAEFGPAGAIAVIVADDERMKVHHAYDPETFESDFNPFEYLDNTRHSRELQTQIINSETYDLSVVDMSELEKEWGIPREKMAEMSETILVAPGLESEYRTMSNSNQDGLEIM